jgi:hypothetical protein
MKDQVDLEFGEESLEKVGVEDGARDLAVDEGRDVGIQRIDVERYDRQVPLPGEVRHQGVTNLAIGAGYQDDGFPHRATVYVTICTNM